MKIIIIIILRNTFSDDGDGDGDDGDGDDHGDGDDEFEFSNVGGFLHDGDGDDANYKYRGDLLIVFNLIPSNTDERLSDAEVARIYGRYEQGKSDEDAKKLEEETAAYVRGTQPPNHFYYQEEKEEEAGGGEESADSNITLTPEELELFIEEEAFEGDVQILKVVRNDGGDDERVGDYDGDKNEYIFNFNTLTDSSQTFEGIMARARYFALKRKKRDAVLNRRKFARSVLGFLIEQKHQLDKEKEKERKEKEKAM